MSEWFASGHVVDVILALMVIEGIGLCAVRALTGRGLSVRSVAAFLISGGSLMLALRGALLSSPWEMISVWLLVGLTAHLFDIAWRWE